jgi:hypothetical protein
MYPMTITLNNGAQLAAVISALAALVEQDAQPVVSARVEAPAPAAEPKAKAKPAPEPDAPEPAPAAEPAKPIEYAQVGAAITAYAAKHGRQATMDKLSRLGVKTGKELKPEQFEQALADFSGEEA